MIGQGDTTSKESHSPLNLSLDSLIVSYSSHVGGIVEAIKKKYDLMFYSRLLHFHKIRGVIVALAQSSESFFVNVSPSAFLRGHHIVSNHDGALILVE